MVLIKGKDKEDATKKAEEYKKKHPDVRLIELEWEVKE